MGILRQLRTVCLPMSLLALSACAEDRTFRVSSVGSASAAEIAESSEEAGTGSGAIVAAGNVLVGAGGQAGSPGWLASAMSSGGVLTGSVSTVLLDSGQTLVQLENGTAFLLDGTSANVGDAVSINLASGQVVAGPPALIGADVLAAAPGNAAATTSTSAGAGPIRGALSGSAGQQTITTGSSTSTVTGTVNGLLMHGCC